jgi:hypothetical protein
VRHIVLAVELGTLGVAEEAAVRPLGPSTPPPA